MAKARAETCTHPLKRCERVSFLVYRCKRCDAVIRDPAKVFEWQHSDRTKLRQGDMVHVRGGPHGSSFKGVFLYAECFTSGLAYCIAEKQRFQQDKLWFAGTAAMRYVRPEHVRPDDGVRARKRRAEEKGE